MTLDSRPIARRGLWSRATQNEAFMKVLKIAYQPYKWLVVIPMVGISLSLFGTGAVISSYFSKKAACMFWGAWWARFMCGITPMKLDVVGRENIDHSKSYIVVANHQSVYDMLSIFGYLKMNLRWVMKKQLRKIPFLGFTSYRVGNVFVDRNGSGEDIKRLHSSKGRIKDGISMFFFVEGTRSKDGKLGKFKKGAFMMAIEMGVPILPVTVAGTNKILPAPTLDLFPGKCKMVIHEPVDTGRFNKENIDELVKEVRTTIGSTLDKYQ